jgi:hypothetical protein
VQGPTSDTAFERRGSPERYFPPSPIHGADMGTIGLVSEQEPTKGRCSLCGRKSEDVTTRELGNWIVHQGGILVCSGCSSDADKAAAGPETFGRQERVEESPVVGSSTAAPVRAPR